MVTKSRIFYATPSSFPFPDKIMSFHGPRHGIIAAFVLFSLIPYGRRLTLLTPAQFLHSYISQTTIKYIFGAMCGIHALESLYTLSLCLKHRASFRVTVG
jgi:hypothetical protein